MIKIYTDGSCLGNPGPGGWGAVIIYPDGNEKELSGADLDTTNNRMELQSVIEALDYLESGSIVEMFSDSLHITFFRDMRKIIVFYHFGLSLS